MFQEEVFYKFRLLLHNVLEGSELRLMKVDPQEFIPILNDIALMFFRRSFYELGGRGAELGEESHLLSGLPFEHHRIYTMHSNSKL